ncbi:protein translocase subunit SecA [Actinorhabdospora filicis]|uniref:Protein translocase subunit SecA n=2 Tax=Actinorhabdospora filicis TaxID=1785913 RepID=A0A9W6SHT4_9ACTN|nr:protein translocase subunit SecA [Actinorhabdospora filicis]
MLKRLKAIADAVNSIEDDYVEMTDEELRAQTDAFKERLEEGETLDDLLPEAFAVVREAAKRVLDKRHYDVQIMGGAALHFGNIAEMKTGEGKTLVSTLPVYLNALAGKGVHVVTVNDYLAQRDAEWMGQVHQFLGLTVGVILPNEPSSKHREAYACDITYGTNNEFGFDYLRDNMAATKENLVQRGHFFSVVDEVDSILIDEARTPLIISGPAEHSSRWYTEFAKIIDRLKKGEGEDYEVDEGKRTVSITERGVAKVEDRLGVDNLYESTNTALVGYLNNAIKAKELFKKDRDYIVRDGEVLIVDEFTGRILAGRRYNEGMHQAIEAKEGVQIKQENQTLATVTLQNYFRLYDKLSGMTGTATTEAGEFNKVYRVGVVEIPTHRSMVRDDRSDVIYKTEAAKFEAVIEDIVERHELGQPVLVGTVSVENSELLSTLLKKRGIAHAVLNAKYHAREAEIVAQAGRKSAVTVATNMAGRGTDILLGGNPEFLAAAELRQRGITEDDGDKYADEWESALQRWKEECDREGEEVIDAGGLYVLGTERHESRRIDNQLRGRAGRQGDPGESRFYLSLEDDLMRRINAAAVQAVMNRLNIPDDVPIESKMVTRLIRNAQSQIEQQNAEMRKNVLKYDEVMNQQRTVIYDERRMVLDGEDVNDQVTNMIDDVVTAYVTGATANGYAEDWDLEELHKALKLLYPTTFDYEKYEEEGSRDKLDAESLLEEVLKDAHDAYARREETIGEEDMRYLERRVLLTIIDQKWREHLYEMDYLKEGINLRAYAQRDPVVEYQREGFELFSQMLEGIKEDTVRFLFNVEVQVRESEDDEEASPADKVGVGPQVGTKAGDIAEAAKRKPSPSRIEVKGLRENKQPQRLQYTSPTIDGEAGSGAVQVESEDASSPTRRRSGPGSATAAGAKQAAPGQATGSGPSRNGPCPCGSGKKYKRCHGAPGA